MDLSLDLTVPTSWCAALGRHQARKFVWASIVLIHSSTFIKRYQIMRAFWAVFWHWYWQAGTHQASLQSCNTVLHQRVTSRANLLFLVTQPRPFLVEVAVDYCRQRPWFWQAMALHPCVLLLEQHTHTWWLNTTLILAGSDAASSSVQLLWLTHMCLKTTWIFKRPKKQPTVI